MGRRAPHPRGGSFGIEVYRRLPNDTDFTILARGNIPGLNFAAVDDGYSYHTAQRCTRSPVARDSLRLTGENIVAIATGLDGMDITKRQRWEATYFDIGEVSALSYGMVLSWIIAAAALLLGVVAWIRVMSAALNLAGPLRWSVAAVWSLDRRRGHRLRNDWNDVGTPRGARGLPPVVRASGSVVPSAAGRCGLTAGGELHASAPASRASSRRPRSDRDLESRRCRSGSFSRPPPRGSHQAPRTSGPLPLLVAALPLAIIVCEPIQDEAIT